MPRGFTLNTQQVDAAERLKAFLKNKNEKMIVLEGLRRNRKVYY